MRSVGSVVGFFMKKWDLFPGLLGKFEGVVTGTEAFELCPFSGENPEECGPVDTERLGVRHDAGKAHSAFPVVFSVRRVHRVSLTI